MESKETKSLNLINNWATVLILCATLGLAPFFPEPHIWGKIRWIGGGANGMNLVDWGDLVMHGLPWVFLIRLLIKKMSSKSHPAQG
jgi:hypothetical protein